MGSIFKPKVSAPPPPPPPKEPPKEAEPPKEVDPKVREARQKERRRQVRESSRRRTILTGPQGLSDDKEKVGQKVLLGQ